MNDIETPRKMRDENAQKNRIAEGRAERSCALKVAKQQQSARSLWPNFQINDALTEGAVFTQRALMAQSC